MVEKLAATWLRSIPAGVVRVSGEDEESARRIIFRHRDKAFSYCDAASFALMARLRIRRAIAFDEHFRQYGKFTLLEP